MNKAQRKNSKILYISKCFRRKQTASIILGAKVKDVCKNGEIWILKL
jgi:hypothetical protein